MSFSRVIHLYLNLDAQGNPLVSARSNLQPRPTLQLIQGDTFTVRLWPLTETGNQIDPLTTARLATGTKPILAGKAANTLHSTTLLFISSTWTEGNTIPGDDSGDWYYESTLNLNTTELATAMAALSATAQSLSAKCDIELQNTDNSERLTYQFDASIQRQVYSGAEGLPTPAPTLPVFQVVEPPAHKTDFFMLPGGVAPTTGNYTASDGSYNYTIQGGWPEWRRAAIAAWLLLVALLLSCAHPAAAAEMLYMTGNGSAGFQERTLALTPGAVLAVDGNGTLTSAAPTTAVPTFTTEAPGLVPSSGGIVPPLSTPTPAVALTPAGWELVASQTAFSNHYYDTANPHNVTASQIGLGAVENIALSTWAGSGNITTIGTLTSGAVPWSLVSTRPSTLAGYGITDAASLSGNNTFTGSNAFAGSVNFSLATDFIFPRVNIGTADYGWTYNPAAGGQVEFRFPGGVAAFYQTGTPAIPYFYFPGQIQADYISGTIQATTINANALTGSIPAAVVHPSLGTIGNWMEGDSRAGSVGLTYVTDPDSPGGSTKEPVAGDYYPIMRATLVNLGTNTVAARYQSAVQFAASTHPSASVSLDFPSIAGGGSASLTITVSGAVTTNTPSVDLGWSAALPAGLVVAQAFVSAANTVTVTLANITASPIDPAAVTCRASITQY